MEGNPPPPSSSSSEQESAKKMTSPFDNLSREDLIKKCRGLLGIAQKAKQAKDECHEENKKLREQLSQAETQKAADKDCLKAMQEMVGSLTEQKLGAAMKVDELEKTVAGLRRELEAAALLREQLSVENEACQRQIKRITDENEELFGDLGRMEGQMKEMSGKLKELEEENGKIGEGKDRLEKELLKIRTEGTVSSGKEEKLVRKLKLYKNKVQEISAKILLLKSDRKILMKTVKDYSEQVPKWQKELVNVSNVLFNRIQLLEKENKILKEKLAGSEQGNEELEKLRLSVIEYEEKVKQLNARNEELLQQTSVEEAANEEKVLRDRQMQELSNELEHLKHLEQQGQEKLKALEEEKQKLLDRLTEMESNNALQDLQDKFEQLQRNSQLEATEKETLSKKNEELEAEIIEAKQKLQNLGDIEQSKLNLEMENKHLQERLKTSQEKQLDQQEQEKTNALEEEKQKLLEKLSEMESNTALEDLQEKFDKLQLSSQLESTEKETLNKKIEELEAEISEVKLKLQKLEETEQSKLNLEIENKNLQERLEGVQEEQRRREEEDLEKKSTNIQILEEQLQKEVNEQENLRKLLQEAELIRQQLQESNENLSKKIEELQTSSSQSSSEHQQSLQLVQDELNARNNQISEFEKKIQHDQEQNEKLSALQGRYDLLAVENHNLKENSSKIPILEEQLQKEKDKQAILQKRLQKAKESNENLSKQIDELQASSDQSSSELQQRLQLVQDELNAKNDQLSAFEKKLQLDQEQNEKLSALQGRFDLLSVENQTLQSDLATTASKLDLIKLENTDLLSELKEINEILKERGGVISLQLSKISELESQKSALQQKLNELDAPDLVQLRARAQDLERALAERESELAALRNQSFDAAQSDVMSVTSSLSRAEESARMREVDDSFEEKYNKLRSLAVKLKKKVAEQTLQLQKYAEKEREAESLSASSSSSSLSLGKNLQSLQTEYDKLLDELEAERKNGERLQEQIKNLEEQLDKQRQEIETLNHVRSEVDSGKKDKSSLESTIREYREQVQSLKREKEAFNLAKKDIDAENQKLKATLKTKEKQLVEEMEAHRELKAEVEKLRLAAKKANLLNLEMEAYEKSLGELNRKLEAKKEQVKELEERIGVQEGSIQSLKSQIALLEQSLAGERSHSQELKKNVDVQQEKLRVSEHQRGEANVELAQLKVEYERVKMEIETNRVELGEAVSEKEKACSGLETEKNKLTKQIYGLEGVVEELKVKIKEKEQEVEDVRTEFASYKIRAQSVLRQNQNKDGSKERELEEELQTLQKTLELSQTKLQTFTQQITELSKSCEELKDDKNRLQNRCKELHDLVEESRLQNESLMEESRRSNLNHQEALKNQRLQNETLVNCYKKQIEELQEKHSMEIETLQSRITQTTRHSLSEANNNILQASIPFPRGSQQISDEQKISLLLMEREEGEGSESTNSQHNQMIPRRKISSSSQQNQLVRTRTNRDLIPLDELLNSSFDDAASTVFDDSPTDGAIGGGSPTVELQQTKEKLTKQESRVRHLTALLAEAEQDLAKLTQLNELLKEEVRRHERSIEREKHVHNSEYLKNVIFKFLTLNSGDEKSRLVPVLNTILRLSPDETQKLNNVARGNDGGGRGWTGLLWN